MARTSLTQTRHRGMLAPMVEQATVISESVEHDVWCPDGYLSPGIHGQRIAIAGHSHWSDDPDHPGFTRDLLQDVVDGDRIRFFTSIAHYFGFEDVSEFWSRALFFNFLPSLVGPGSERYGHGTQEQIAAGTARVTRILESHRPQKLFVFSTKAWHDFPLTEEDQGHLPRKPFPSWQTYLLKDGAPVKACGLRHPQGADLARMTADVSTLMSL